jgi:hypothetical protein
MSMKSSCKNKKPYIALQAILFNLRLPYTKNYESTGGVKTSLES